MSDKAPLEFTAKVTSGGKITIPTAVRELLRIGEGDIVTMAIQEVAKKTEG